MDKKDTFDHHRKERIENVQCSDAEAAVAKHFEESLRRAKLLPYPPESFRASSSSSSISITPASSASTTSPSPHKSISQQYTSNFNYATYPQHFKEVKILPMPPKLISSETKATTSPASVIVSKPRVITAEHFRLLTPQQVAEIYKHHPSNPLSITPSAQVQLQKTPRLPPVTITPSQSPNLMQAKAQNQSLAKPKIPTPAPAKFYGMPGETGISIGQDLTIQCLQRKPIVVTQPVNFSKTVKSIPSTSPSNIDPQPAHTSRSLFNPPQLYYTPKEVKTIPSSKSSPISSQNQPLNLGLSDRNRQEITTTTPQKRSTPQILNFACDQTKKVKVEKISQARNNTPQLLASPPLKEMGLSPLALTTNKTDQTYQRQVIVQKTKHGQVNPVPQERQITIVSPEVKTESPAGTSFSTQKQHCSPKIKQENRSVLLSKQYVKQEPPNPVEQQIKQELRQIAQQISFETHSPDMIPIHTVIKTESVPVIISTTPSAVSHSAMPADLTPGSSERKLSESEKSSGETTPRNLKKAWLHRHTTGEDSFESSGMASGGGGESNSSSSSSALRQIKCVTASTNRVEENNSQVKKEKKKKQKVEESPATEAPTVSSTDDDTSSDESSVGATIGDNPNSPNQGGPDVGGENISGAPKSKAKPKHKIKRTKAQKEEIARLKKTGEVFLQNSSCFEMDSKISKCRECRWWQHRREKLTIFCRFYLFRRLKYKKNGNLMIVGFLDPNQGPTTEDLNIWMPDPENPPNLDIPTALYLLNQVGDQFCELWHQEQRALHEYHREDKPIAWKKVVQGIREMCDVCQTSVFNYHWTCAKCGFCVCVDCFRDRSKNIVKSKGYNRIKKGRDEFSWLQCSATSQPHDLQALVLTQIIAGNALQILGQRIHELRQLWQVPQLCECELSKTIQAAGKNSIYDNLIRLMVNMGYKEKDESLVSWRRDMKSKEKNEYFEREYAARQREMLNDVERAKRARMEDGKGDEDGAPAVNMEDLKERAKAEAIQRLADKGINIPLDGDPDTAEMSTSDDSTVYVHQKPVMTQMPRLMTYSASRKLYPYTPHIWLCDGKLLRLPDPFHIGNEEIFRDQWKNGQPVIVSDVTKFLNIDLWRPEAFCRDFGEQLNDLVNCLNGKIVQNQPMKHFWEGFQNVHERLVDSRGVPMLLKLKDWPPGDDFAEIMPDRYTDLLKALPLPEYTHRTGLMNLASRLPDIFVRPDLGPKMYNAYGSALYPDRGTTNLHLDISDAVNVMVYVGIPEGKEREQYAKIAYRSIDDAGCDILMRRRVREKNELPGAIWHIYSAKDADKIRMLLAQVQLEKGKSIEPHSDPIHDQTHYLDRKLRERLYLEYGVTGYTIAQCLGDAIFIPAGAPHQVRNLYNCIKVAEDFVSPQNISHSFSLTGEFRLLSDSHSNHEDKLQVKNIIYHAMKDVAAYLTHCLNKKITENSRSSDGTEPLIKMEVEARHAREQQVAGDEFASSGT